MHNPVIGNNISPYNRWFIDKVLPAPYAYFERGICSGGQGRDTNQRRCVSDEIGDNVLLERFHTRVRCASEYVVGIGEERCGLLINCTWQASRCKGTEEVPEITKIGDGERGDLGDIHDPKELSV